MLLMLLHISILNQELLQTLDIIATVSPSSLLWTTESILSTTCYLLYFNYSKTSFTLVLSSI